VPTQIWPLRLELICTELAEGMLVAQGPQPVVEVSMEALEQLTAMGFEERRARAALQQCRNDVQLALNMLV